MATHGNTTYTPAELAARKAEIVRLHDAGQSFHEIGLQLGIGRQWAHKVYWQAVAEVPALAVNEMRAQQNERLEQLIERTQKIMNRAHVVTSGGTIVRDKNGEPLKDSGPELHAIATQARLLEQQAKLNGVNAPVQVSIGGEIRFEVAGVDMEALT